MRKNKIWMRFLIIGLIINLIGINSSCKDGYYPIYGEYYFVNETSYTITSEARGGIFNVGPKSTRVFNEKMAGEEKKAIISNYSSPLRHYGKEIIIKFNDVKCLINVKENDMNSIRDIKNFVAERINNNTYKFTYTFTEADYNRATTCP